MVYWCAPARNRCTRDARPPALRVMINRYRRTPTSNRFTNFNVSDEIGNILMSTINDEIDLVLYGSKIGISLFKVNINKIKIARIIGLERFNIISC